MIDLIIVIPCYNEYDRLLYEKYISFLKSSKDIYIIFVDDGSIDNTIEQLEKIKLFSPKKVKILSNNTNKGKAHAVQMGMLYASKKLKSNKIGYLDADLSTPFKEIIRLSSLVSKNIKFVFGSRILKLDNEIIRKKYRFIIGRIIATIISKMLKISVYDTQCGCKVMNYNLIPDLFEEKFISKWLFDVELFFRLKRKFGENNIRENCLEVALKKWIDTNDSRVNFSYFFKIWIDLYKINYLYNYK